LETSKGALIEPDDISLLGANKQYAFRWHKSRTTVEQYYFVKHGITLKHSYLPCIVVYGGKDHRYYYPIETLSFNVDTIELQSLTDLVDDLLNI
jgi:hypothetical protein